MHEPWIYALALIAGALAGFINTLAGSGSLISLPMLIFLGLPAPIANGTNRIGIIFQNVVGLWKFRQHQNDLALDSFLIVPSVLGSVLGAWLAVDLDARTMDLVIAAVLALMGVLIVMQPEKWLRAESETGRAYRTPTQFLLFLAIGFYGGFIQAGVGLFLLAAMVLRCGYSLKHANAVKLAIILAFTLPAVLIFARQGQIHWGLGLLMALGQSVGAWLAASFATHRQDAAVWMHRLLLAIICVSIVKLLGWLPF